MNRKFLINLGYILLLLLLCIPVVLPYFRSGYFPTHDGEWAVVRLGDMFRTLKDFQFPVRMSGALNFGYGYPLFNFAYLFPYYLGILFYIPFHSFITSIKSLFVVSVFFSAVFMYYASSLLWKNRISGVISSILYIYLPYRMIDLYVRGSIGESLSLALFPLIFYLAVKLFDNAFKRTIVVILPIAIASLVMTHNIMTVLFMPVLISFMLYRIISEKRVDVLQSLLLCLGLGAMLSAFFWFPALFEKSNILLSKVPIADRNLYFVKPLQLIIPQWGYGTPTEGNPFSYQLGVGQLLGLVAVVAVALGSLIKSKFKFTPAKKYLFVLLTIYVVCILFMFAFTSFIWKTIPLLSEINYPWTLLAVIGFLCALMVGFIGTQTKYIQYSGLLIALVAMALVFPYAKPESYSSKTDDYYLTNEATTTSSSELMPLWVKEFPKEHYKSKVEVIGQPAEISDLKFNSKYLHFKYSASSNTVFKINTIYYPGWVAYVDNEKVDISYDNPNGVMIIPASKYRTSVNLYFQETIYRQASDIVSALAVIIILFILMRPLLQFKS